jgi:hypothetical protein
MEMQVPDCDSSMTQNTNSRITELPCIGLSSYVACLPLHSERQGVSSRGSNDIYLAEAFSDKTKSGQGASHIC